MALTARSLHKWIAIGIGILILLWVVTGVVMIMPAAPTPERQVVSVSYPAAIVSPANALLRLARPDSAPLGSAVRSLALVRVGDRLAYNIVLADGRSRLVDAHSGELIEIDARLAEAVVRTELARDIPVSRVEPVGERVAEGRPAAFRVVLDDPAATWVQVSTRDGALSFSSAKSRFHAQMGSLHTFAALRAFYDSGRLQRWLVVAASAASLLLILTGYWLSLPARWRRRILPSSAA